MTQHIYDDLAFFGRYIRQGPLVEGLAGQARLRRSAAILALACAALLAGCASDRIDRGTYIADTSHRAVSHDSRIRYLVLHYTALDDADSLRVLTTQAVSVHYLVPRHPAGANGGAASAKPTVLALVPESERAWHAGDSRWQRAADLNDSSIGIEIVNLGPLDAQTSAWDPFNREQIDTVIRIARDIVTRYHIATTRVVAHADIAPQRKDDPGPLFPWRELAQAGIGAWWDEADVARHLDGRDPKAPADVLALQRKLAEYGYDVPVTGVLDAPTRRVLRAFQMHFRASDYAGDADAQSDAIVSTLLDKYGATIPGTALPSDAYDTH
jgi:N-acetylmuramoyl-L-alanine amidase